MHGIVHVSISTLEIAKRALLDHYGELRLMFGDEWVTTILEAKQIVVYPGMYLARCGSHTGLQSMVVVYSNKPHTYGCAEEQIHFIEKSVVSQFINWPPFV